MGLSFFNLYNADNPVTDTTKLHLIEWTIVWCIKNNIILHLHLFQTGSLRFAIVKVYVPNQPKPSLASAHLQYIGINWN